MIEVLLLKVSATFNNGKGKLDMYLFIYFNKRTMLYRQQHVTKSIGLKYDENKVINIILSKLIWIHKCSIILYVISVYKLNIYLR